MEKKRKAGHEEDEYINSDFILGSVSRVERRWSTAKYVSTYYRRRMTPPLFEALLFFAKMSAFRMQD